MKLQPASRKEIKRIALGTLACDGLLVAGLWLLSQFGIGTFDLVRIVLSAACGSVIAVANFTILCLTVQSAVEIESKRKMKARFQLSYNIRMVIQAGWVVVCFLVKPLHFVAGSLPILFPNVVIFYLQFTGRLMPKEEAKAVSQDVPEDGLQNQ